MCQNIMVCAKTNRARHDSSTPVDAFTANTIQYNCQGYSPRGSHQLANCQGCLPMQCEGDLLVPKTCKWKHHDEPTLLKG